MDFKNFKITDYRDSVSALPDYPSDAGYTAEKLKAVFDSRTDNEIKEKFNALVDELITKFGLVESDIADAVEDHNQYEDAHEKIIAPMREQISDILLELISMNISIESKADGLETKTQLSALDLFLTGTTNELHDHTGARNNPHELTPAQIGLDKVNNTPDNEKNVAFAISAKKDSLGNSIHEHYATKDEVGNVDLSDYVPREEFTLRVEPIENSIDHIYDEIGDIDTALDELHSYAEALAGGDA